MVTTELGKDTITVHVSVKPILVNIFVIPID